MPEITPFPALPVLVQAVLLPFEGKIIYDSLFVPYPVTFGSGIRRNLNDGYRQIQERGEVIISLDPRSVEDLAGHSTPAIEKCWKLSAKTSLLLDKAEDDRATRQHDYDFHRRLFVGASDPPRSLLDLDVDDLQRYQRERGKSSDLVSFKRLVRFLLNTGRIYWDNAEDMQDFLKRRQRETTSKS